MRSESLLYLITLFLSVKVLSLVKKTSAGEIDVVFGGGGGRGKNRVGEEEGGGEVEEEEGCGGDEEESEGAGRGGTGGKDRVLECGGRGREEEEKDVEEEEEYDDDDEDDDEYEGTPNSLLIFGMGICSSFALGTTDGLRRRSNALGLISGDESIINEIRWFNSGE